MRVANLNNSVISVIYGRPHGRLQIDSETQMMIDRLPKKALFRLDAAGRLMEYEDLDSARLDRLIVVGEDCLNMMRASSTIEEYAEHRGQYQITEFDWEEIPSWCQPGRMTEKNAKDDIVTIEQLLLKEQIIQRLLKMARASK